MAQGQHPLRRGGSPAAARGLQIAFVAQFLGRRIAYTYKVREHVFGVRFVMSTQQGPFPMETTYRWEDAPGGTRMSLRNRGVPSISPGEAWCWPRHASGERQGPGEPLKMQVEA